MLRNIPARKDFRHGNLRLFHLNHRLLIGLIGPKIKLTVVNYQQIVLSWQLVVSDGSGGGGGVEAQMRQSSAVLLLALVSGNVISKPPAFSLSS